MSTMCCGMTTDSSTCNCDFCIDCRKRFGTPRKMGIVETIFWALTPSYMAYAKSNNKDDASNKS